jgi:glycosyltransferase involved in cell wall biosynthesis
MEKKIFKAAVLRSTDVDPEPRTEQAINSLKKMGFDVTLLNWQRSDKPLYGLRKEFKRVSFVKPATYGNGIGNFVGQATWQFWVAKKLLSNNYDLVYACDADTALIAVLLKKLKNYKLIYDQFDPISSRYRNKILRFWGNQIESLLFRTCHLSVVPSELRMVSGLNNQVIVSNNFNKTLRKPKERGSDSLKIAYFGILQPDRGLIELLKCLETDLKIELTIAGFGIISRDLENVKSSKFRFLGKLDYEKGLELIADSDISYVMYNPKFEHNRKTASGKFLDSIIAGTPCIVAAGTALATFTSEFNLGWSVEYGNVDALYELLDELTSTRELPLANFENNQKLFLDKLQLSNEENSLITSIQGILKGEI